MLDYEILKYPKSEDKEINQAFKKIVKEIDNFHSNEIDLVYQSEVKFEYS